MGPIKLSAVVARCGGPAEQLQCLYIGSGLGTHIIQAFPTLLTSKTLVIAKSEGSFRRDFLPQAGTIEHITSSFILMKY